MRLRESPAVAFKDGGMVKLKIFAKRLDGALLHTSKDQLELFKHFTVQRVLGVGSFATV